MNLKSKCTGEDVVGRTFNNHIVSIWKKEEREGDLLLYILSLKEPKAIYLSTRTITGLKLF